MTTNVLALGNPALKQNNLAGTVIHISENSRLLVKTDQGILNVTKAFSCLVKPEKNDRVLINECDGEFYILAIISRDTKSVSLEVNGDLTISANGDLQQNSQNHNILTHKLSANAPEVDIKGCKFQYHMKQSTVFSESSTFSGKSFYQRLEQVVRWVDFLETVNINNWIQNIRNTLSTRSKNAIVTAKGDMKIDAERIHMG